MQTENFIKGNGPNPYWDDEEELADGPGFAQHPGPVIKRILEDRDIKITTLATHLGVARPGLNNLLNGKGALTGAMATKLGDALDYPAEVLITMMGRHELAMADEPANHVEKLVVQA